MNKLMTLMVISTLVSTTASIIATSSQDMLRDEMHETMARHALELRKELTPPPAPDMVYDPISLANNRTLAVKNKNPFNVKVLNSGGAWQGQQGVDHAGHVKFESWEHGVRAAASTLLSYEKKYGIKTIRGIVTRFAQGNHDSYFALLSKALGVGVDEPFVIHKRMPELLKAMCKQECGMTLPDTLLIPYTVLEKI